MAGRTAVFTGRAGGVSSGPYASLNLATHVADDAAAVAENRRRAAARLGVPPERVVWMSQVHGREVAVVDGPRADPVPAVDALVTTTPGLALAVVVADCAPVLIDAGSAVAAVHAGRRGLELGAVPATLAVLTGLGADLNAARAWIGPCAGACCYEVPVAMRNEVAGAAPAAAAVTRAGTPAVDLRAGLREQLAAGGVAHVEVSGACTIHDDSYFSYRRDGVTGRAAGLIVRR